MLKYYTYQLEKKESITIHKTACLKVYCNNNKKNISDWLLKKKKSEILIKLS